MSVGNSSSKAGENLFTVGYPIASQRSSSGGAPAQDSDGDSLTFSHGQVVRNNPTCKINHTDSQGNIKQEQVPITNYNRYQGFLQTTVDILPGNSGGALVNSQNEVIGVASRFAEGVQSSTQECVGGTFFQSALPIAKFIKSKGLRCDSKKFYQGVGI